LKKIFFILILLLSIVQLKSQSWNHHDISLSLGLFHPEGITELKSNILDKLFNDERYVRDNFIETASIFFTYKHILLNDRLMLGSSLGMSQNKGKIYYLGNMKGNIKRNSYTIFFEFYYRYINSPTVQIYSGAALGISYINENFYPSDGSASSQNSSFVPAYQLSVIGIRIGRNLAGFIEFGYGYKGIINLGLSFQFY